jgi:hypothetical protein
VSESRVGSVWGKGKRDETRCLGAWGGGRTEGAMMGRSDSREAGIVTVGDGTKGLVGRVPWSGSGSGSIRSGRGFPRFDFVTGLRWTSDRQLANRGGE